MRLEKEFTFVATLLGELLASLPDSTTKVALIGHTTACMTLIEQDLRGGMDQVSELVLDAPLVRSLEETQTEKEIKTEE